MTRNGRWDEGRDPVGWWRRRRRDDLSLHDGSGSGSKSRGEDEGFGDLELDGLDGGERWDVRFGRRRVNGGETVGGSRRRRRRSGHDDWAFRSSTFGRGGGGIRSVCCLERREGLSC